MFRHTTSTLAACALAGVVSVSAQQPAPAPAPAQQPEQQQPAKETITGCVMEAKTTDGGTAYVLNNAEGGSSSATMYVLAGASQADIAGNVNKKVEVTGPVQQPAPPSDSAAANPKVLRPPAVQVESVKVVEENCK
jgi:hypothetical protein